MEDDMDVSLATILEQRFNCLICWAPKLRMVYGKCQHRLCESCLFDETGKRRRGMDRCPVCSKADSFPKVKPNIPEDNIEAQRMLGVITCGYGCGTEMWRWELPEHISDCPFVEKVRAKSPKLMKETQKALASAKSSRKRKLRSNIVSTKSGNKSGRSTVSRSGKRRRTSRTN